MVTELSEPSLQKVVGEERVKMERKERSLVKQETISKVASGELNM